MHDGVLMAIIAEWKPMGVDANRFQYTVKFGIKRLCGCKLRRAYHASEFEKSCSAAEVTSSLSIEPGLSPRRLSNLRPRSRGHPAPIIFGRSLLCLINPFCAWRK
jgi:hypothetical protein